MSVDDLHAFFTKLENDESLRQEVIALDALGDEERARAVHDIAAREGFTITAEDWQHKSVGPAITSLSDEALRDVVAADGCMPWAFLGGSLGLAGGGCGQSVGAAGGSGCGQSVGKAVGNGCG